MFFGVRDTVLIEESPLEIPKYISGYRTTSQVLCVRAETFPRGEESYFWVSKYIFFWTSEAVEKNYTFLEG